VAIYAGQHLLDTSLPRKELERIYSEVMLPSLAAGDTAGGIVAGLDAIAHDLHFGPPSAPVSAAQRVAAWIGRVPFNLLALLFVGWVIVLARRAPGRPRIPAPIDLRADPPGDLSPALAGALVAGRLNAVQLEAIALDLAHRGALAIEPVGPDKVHVRLLRKPSGLTEAEDDIWQRCEELADADHIVSSDGLPSIQSAWGMVHLALRRELLKRGWYGEHPGRRRRPLYLAGWLGMVAFTVGIVIMIVAGEGWALLGSVAAVVAGTCAFIWGYRIPDTTDQGEQSAVPWREYRASLSAGLPLSATDEQLDAALPYAVAMGVAGAISSRHVSATARGYSPAWFQTREEAETGAPHFYPYWIAFHSCMNPAPSGGYGGGGIAGGAAAGGGGAGGGF
jgi:uncharacterized membrane protein YgcG